MNLLIADSGSTKTDWRLTDGMISVRSQGYNPYQVSGAEMAESMRREVLVALGGNVPGEIAFYGAGCGSEEKREIVRGALAEVFPGAKIEVNSDLLGAARSLCGRESGIAAILGTGSNSCTYDGEKIMENRPSLGYVLGDEGSGAALGKRLLRLYLYGDMDMALKENFVKRFTPSAGDILDHVYRQPLPNRYLASYAKFVFQNIDHPQCVELAAENFRDFFRYHIMRYPQAKAWPLHVTGSVGFYFSNILRRIAEEHGVKLARISETPIAGLVNYHLGVE